MRDEEERDSGQGARRPCSPPALHPHASPCRRSRTGKNLKHAHPPPPSLVLALHSSISLHFALSLFFQDPYTVAASKLYAWAKASNDAGVPFPIWGTCLGHQLLCVLESGAHFQDLFIETDAVSQPAPLTFTDAAPSSRLLAPLFEERPALVEAMTSSPINMENHEFGLPPSAMDPSSSPWPALGAAFDVLATAVDRKGVEYVATMEHKAYPFFGKARRSEREEMDSARE